MIPEILVASVPLTIAPRRHIHVAMAIAHCRHNRVAMAMVGHRYNHVPMAIGGHRHTHGAMAIAPKWQGIVHTLTGGTRPFVNLKGS